MPSKPALIFRVYRHSLLFVSLSLTGAFVYAIYMNKFSESFSISAILLGRIIIFIPVLYLFYIFKGKEFMYYRNLGISKRELLTGLGVYDLPFSATILILSDAVIR